jgi:hypothetical protein
MTLRKRGRKKASATSPTTSWRVEVTLPAVDLGMRCTLREAALLERQRPEEGDWDEDEDDDWDEDDDDWDWDEDEWEEDSDDEEE